MTSHPRGEPPAHQPPDVTGPSSIDAPAAPAPASTADPSARPAHVAPADTASAAEAPDVDTHRSGSGAPPNWRLRSFVRRAGRTTEGQARAQAELGPRFLLPYRAQPLDFPQTFGRRAPVVLEIGFGMGEATAQIAATLPDIDFLCCEVHDPGIGALLKRIGEQGLTNIRICAHDAVDVIDHMLPPASLAGVHVFFPDPWHKKRHHKRRLIQPPLVHKLAQRLAPGGYLHCATDWQPYAEQMLAVLAAEPLLRNTASDYAPRPAYRPPTKFENRGLRLGHGVWDLVFTRHTPANPAA